APTRNGSAVRADLGGGEDPLANAIAIHDAGDVFTAFAQARPVFEAHPDDLAIQDTRCKWALEAGASGDDLHRECAAYNRLLFGDKAPAWAKAPAKGNGAA